LPALVGAMALGPPVTLVLAPIDQGVRNLGGRDGAREGPADLFAALREADRVPPTARVRRIDVGNEPGTLEAGLDALSAAVGDELADGRTPIVFGGDHGTTYATVRGAARALGEVGVCYLDVHLDLRPFEPEHTSGSSFRRLVDEGHVDASRVRPMGIEVPGEADAGFEELAAYADEAGVAWVELDEARRRGPGELAREAMAEGTWCASFDVDALDRAHAPGVSAPGADRFALEEARAFLEAAVEQASVLDVAEYAPRHDEDGRTRATLVDLVGGVLERLG